MPLEALEWNKNMQINRSVLITCEWDDYACFLSDNLPVTFAVGHPVCIHPYCWYLHYPHSTRVGEVA
jgi:hypothetical protein